ncbi:MFS transporter [Chloroflexota bacterium]
MIKKKFSLRDIYFGWWTVISTGTISGLAHGFNSYGFSVIFKPLAAELNLNRAITSVAAGIARLEGGLEAPLTGWLSDKFGPKWVIFTGTIIAMVGMFLMYYANSLWAYYLFWGGLIGIGINLSMTIAMDKAVTNWFIRKRGLAHGTKFAIIGLFGVIAIPLISWIVEEAGWRNTCLIWAGVMLICLPFILITIKQKRPEYYGLLPDGAKSEAELGTADMMDRGVEYASGLEEEEFTLRQAMRTPAFWMIVVAMAGHTVVFGGFNTHCIPFLTDRGIDEVAAGAMMGMMVFFTIPSRFIGGIIADRVKKRHMSFLLAGSLAFQAAGLGIFCLFPSPMTVYVMLILYGFGSGATTPFYLLILARFFGRKAYGSIHGATSLLRSPVQFISPVYAGWVYDTTGNYMTAFIVFAITAAAAALVMFACRPPRTPDQIGDVRSFV